jgi:alpha,alpha-trehalose phosphorylase
MAAQNLREAADAVERHLDAAAKLEVDDEEAAGWRAAANAVYLPFDSHLRVHPQADGFTAHQVWNFRDTKEDQYPLLLSFPYFDLYRQQVVKQADLVLALHLQGEHFDADQKDRDFVYYERLTVRDSSLSAPTQAVVAAELGYLDLAYDYLAEAAMVDLEDRQRNTRDGVHIAALAGGWTALVAGFGGFRAKGGELRFSPRVPVQLARIGFRICYRGRRVRVEATRDQATYRLESGDPLEVFHHGEPFRLEGDPVRMDVPPQPDKSRPSQPAGRSPRRRHGT